MLQDQFMSLAVFCIQIHAVVSDLCSTFVVDIFNWVLGGGISPQSIFECILTVATYSEPDSRISLHSINCST